MGTLHAFLPIRRAARRFAKPPDVDEKSRCAGGYRIVKGVGAQHLWVHLSLHEGPHVLEMALWEVGGYHIKDTL